MRYKVDGNKLIYSPLIKARDSMKEDGYDDMKDEHLWSPNDLTVLSSGEIYVSNAYSSYVTMFLPFSTVVHYNPSKPNKGRWQVSAEGIRFANGILAIEKKDAPTIVYLSTTIGGKLIEYERQSDGKLTKKRIIGNAKGLDNLTINRNNIITTAHPKLFNFLMHGTSNAKKKKRYSPTIVYSFSLKVDEKPHVIKKELYIDPIGSFFSAASTAKIINNKLIISQVFNSNILICNLPPTK